MDEETNFAWKLCISYISPMILLSVPLELPRVSMSCPEHVNAVFDLIDDDSEDAQLKPLRTRPRE